MSKICNDLDNRIEQAYLDLAPEARVEFAAYVYHLLEAEKSGKPPLEPAEFSQGYRSQLGELCSELAARFAPLPQQFIFASIAKVASENPEIPPKELLPKAEDQIKEVVQILHREPAA